MEPIGPARVRAARDLLTEEPDAIVALAGHVRCSTCGAMVPTKGQGQHALWHQAMAVLAGRVFGPEASS
ncbi:hypothetical protein GCM10023201_40640 [Actinomycetospora corticicola]|uniref:Uncharacterized protein n=1 Tax=Actinomycetospora corticicola TaxID=663602 RepID=A0A7Y9DWJ7_9PSEU|nr:hypothetical protein [Actinomycetospora corticicola]NYD36852.1 hypothetical protein [Actinomycetospora corticicola]